MTPQLQQAIRLLQLSSLELQEEIQDVLDSNIMLEIAEDEYETPSIDEPDLDLSQEKLTEQQEERPSNEIVREEIPTELPVDTDWEDIYDGSLSPYDYPNYNSKDKDSLFNNESSAAETTLQDHLRWQLDLTPFSDLDRAIATALIDAIDSSGYLRASLGEIAESLTNYPPVSTLEIETVLHRIQHFDPVGVGARDLSECLLLQLAEYKVDTPWLTEAKKLIEKYLPLLGTHDYAQLTKRMKLSRENLGEVIKLIQSLTPQPGALLDSLSTTYIIPDVFMKKIKGEWIVQLNSDISPKVRINNHYAELIPQINNREDNKSLKTHLQEARWFLKSLESRHETLLKVTKSIVKHQLDFFEYGDEAMKPLILQDIAKELDMHESTISRVTTHKYLHTHRGIFELKYFFSSHVSTSNGGECSSTAIRAMIKKLIAAENTAKPLSDNKIANHLSDRGIQVARRTVAKYREAMLIPPSNERKRLVIQ
jgi:RNA polymerase sigma-54 factor